MSGRGTLRAMSLDKRHLVAAIALFGIFLLVGGTFFVFSDRLQSQSAVAVTGQLQVCARGGDLIACARQPIQKLLETKSGTEVMQTLSDTVSPTQCHAVGHIVGQELYRRYKNVEPALAQCSYACFSACIHGAIGQAFVQEAGMNDDSVDPEHLSIEEIRSVGKKLCTAWSACHGVGHALFLQSSQIDPSISVCRDIADGRLRSSCFAGVYMEYQQEITSTSAWQSSSTPAVLSLKDLSSLCKKSSPEESSACFAYFTPIAIDAFINAGEATSTVPAYPLVRKLCESYSDKSSRYFCVFGYGAYRYQSVLTDSAVAVRICERFSRESDQSACVSGMVSRAGQYNKLDKVLAYCGAIPTERVGAQCYTDAFSLYMTNGGTIDDAKKACPPEKSLCYQQAENYAETPDRFRNPQFE